MTEIRKPDPALMKTLPRAVPREGETYVPSRFTLTFGHKSGQYVFNTLTKQLIRGSLPASAKAGEGFDELIEGMFLVPEGRDETAFYNGVSSVMRAYSAKKGYRYFTVLPTTACNARCVYCYEEGVKPVSMTDDTVRQTVRFILDNRAEGRAEINWFGGEPLLRPDIIDRVCAGLKAAGADYRCKMVSNGSLVTPEIISKMAGEWRLESLQISMDGAEKDYIPRKNYFACDGAYFKVIAGVDAMAGAGIRVTVRCNVDGDNWANIPEFLNDMEQRVRNKRNVTIYFAPLFQARESGGDLELYQKILDARQTVISAGFRTTGTGAYAGRFRVFHCMADSGAAVIGPDGSLYPCEHCPPQARFGDIFRGVTDENARFKFCRADATREKCLTCPFLPHCTSFAACPITDAHCREVMRMLTLAALEDIIDDAGGDAAEQPDC